RSERRFLRGRANDLSDRQISRTVAVRDAASDEHPGLCTQRLDELACKSRLAYARFADDRDDATVLVADRVGVSAAPQLELLLPADERCIEATGIRGCVREHFVDPPRVADRFGPHRIAREGIGLSGEKPSPRRRTSL